MRSEKTQVIEALECIRRTADAHKPYRDESGTIEFYLADFARLLANIDDTLALLRSLPEQGEGPYTIEEIPYAGRVLYKVVGSGPYNRGFYRRLSAEIHADELNAAYQAGRLSAGLAHPPQVGKEDEGDRHKNGAGLSAPMSPKTETISAAIPVANIWIPVSERLPEDGELTMVLYYPWNEEHNGLASQFAIHCGDGVFQTADGGKSYPPKYWFPLNIPRLPPLPTPPRQPDNQEQ